MKDRIVCKPKISSEEIYQHPGCSHRISVGRHEDSHASSLRYRGLIQYCRMSKFASPRMTGEAYKGRPHFELDEVDEKIGKMLKRQAQGVTRLFLCGCANPNLQVPKGNLVDKLTRKKDPSDTEPGRISRSRVEA